MSPFLSVLARYFVPLFMFLAFSLSKLLVGLQEKHLAWMNSAPEGFKTVLWEHLPIQ